MDVLEYFVSMKVNPSISISILIPLHRFSCFLTPIFLSFLLYPSRCRWSRSVICVIFSVFFCQNCLKLCRLIFFAKLRNNFSILFVHFRRPYFAFLGADYGVHLGRKTRNFGSLQSDECGNAIFTWIPTGRRKSSRNPEITLLWNILLCMV